MTVMKIEIVRGDCEGVFRATLYLQDGFGVSIKECTGSLELCNQFINDVCKELKND